MYPSVEMLLHAMTVLVMVRNCLAEVMFWRIPTAGVVYFGKGQDWLNFYSNAIQCNFKVWH